MAYKYKPNKSVTKRFKVTGTGKLKRRHTLSTHLRSARDGNKKRHLGRPAILNEGHARNMRDMMAIVGTRPNATRHLRELKAAKLARAAAAQSGKTPAATTAKPSTRRVKLRPVKTINATVKAPVKETAKAKTKAKA